MKKKLITILITTLFISNSAFAEYIRNNSAYYTGETFFSSPKYIEKEDANSDSLHVEEEPESRNNAAKGTTPPLKQLRLSIQKKNSERQAKNTQLAPTGPDISIYNSDKEVSDFSSKEEKEDFDENMMPDGFEADEDAVKEAKNAKHFWGKGKNKENLFQEENTENIVLDCDNMDYDTDNYCLYATGNVNVEFVKQETTVKADKITYDRMNNTIKAEGNVHILKNGQIIDGEYIFVDMNEENALIENPRTQTATIEIQARKGYVYGDKIIQEDGFIDVKDSYPIKFKPSGYSPIISDMIIPKNQTLTEDMANKKVKVNAKEITITQKGELETIRIKHANVKKGKFTVLKIPALKIYTNKNHDYAETNSWELGSYRDLGMYIGPGFVFELPKGSVLKAIPMLNYSHGIGVGAIGRFNSGTNLTEAGYGTAGSRILIKGTQQLDDHLSLIYGMNEYLDDWWLGRRRPKYGLSLRYRDIYSSDNFLYKGHRSSFEHLFDFGYFHDIDKDHYFGDSIHRERIGTTRARYMAQAIQNLYNYRNVDKQTAFNFDVVSELSASVYGTGDTQVIGRIGPRIHSQFKRWMQDVGYYQAVYDDNSPIMVYDAYRYGKSNLYLREYFRICKYLTLAWFGSLNLSNDSPNDRMFQENTFWLSVGPEDVKFNLGYDIVRESTFFTVEMMMNAKGAQIDYDKLVIKRDKKPKDDINESNKNQTQNTEFKNTAKAPVLEHAKVENIKNEEEVL